MSSRLINEGLLRSTCAAVADLVLSQAALKAVYEHMDANGLAPADEQEASVLSSSTHLVGGSSGPACRSVRVEDLLKTSSPSSSQCSAAITDQLVLVALELSRLQSLYTVLPLAKMKQALQRAGAMTKGTAKRKSGADVGRLVYTPDSSQTERLIYVFSALALCQPMLWESITSAPSTGSTAIAAVSGDADEEADAVDGAPMEDDDAFFERGTGSSHHRASAKKQQQLAGARARLLFGEVVASVVVDAAVLVVDKVNSLAEVAASMAENLGAASPTVSTPTVATAMTTSASSSSAATMEVNRQIQQDALMRGFLAARKGGKNTTSNATAAAPAAADAAAETNSPLLGGSTASAFESVSANFGVTVPPSAAAMASLLATVKASSSFHQRNGVASAASAAASLGGASMPPFSPSPTTAMLGCPFPAAGASTPSSSAAAMAGGAASSAKLAGSGHSSFGLNSSVGGATVATGRSATNASSSSFEQHLLSNGSTPSSLGTSAVRIVSGDAEAAEDGLAKSTNSTTAAARSLFAEKASTTTSPMLGAAAAPPTITATGFRLPPPPPLPLAPITVGGGGASPSGSRRATVTVIAGGPSSSAISPLSPSGPSFSLAASPSAAVVACVISIALTAQLAELLIRCGCGEPLASNSGGDDDGADDGGDEGFGRSKKKGSSANDDLFFNPSAAAATTAGGSSSSAFSRADVFSAAVMANGSTRTLATTRAYYQDIFRGFATDAKALRGEGEDNDDAAMPNGDDATATAAAEAILAEDEDAYWDEVHGNGKKKRKGAAATKRDRAADVADASSSAAAAAVDSSSSSSSHLFVNPTRVPWDRIVNAMAATLRLGRDKCVAEAIATDDELCGMSAAGGSSTAMKKKRARVEAEVAADALADPMAWNPFLAHYAQGYAKLHTSSAEFAPITSSSAAVKKKKSSASSKKKDSSAAAAKESVAPQSNRSMSLAASMASYGSEDIPLPPEPVPNAPLECLLCGEGVGRRCKVGSSSPSLSSAANANARVRIDDSDDVAAFDNGEGEHHHHDDGDDADCDDLTANLRGATAGTANTGGTASNKGLKGLLHCCGCNRYIHLRCVYPTQRELAVTPAEAAANKGFRCHGCRLKGSGATAAAAACNASSRMGKASSYSPPLVFGSRSACVDPFLITGGAGSLLELLGSSSSSAANGRRRPYYSTLGAGKVSSNGGNPFVVVLGDTTASSDDSNNAPPTPVVAPSSSAAAVVQRA